MKLLRMRSSSFINFDFLIIFFCFVLSSSLFSFLFILLFDLFRPPWWHHLFCHQTATSTSTSIWSSTGRNFNLKFNFNLEFNFNFNLPCPRLERIFCYLQGTVLQISRSTIQRISTYSTIFLSHRDLQNNLD